MNLKKMEKYLRVNFLGPGPLLIIKEFVGPRSHEKHCSKWHKPCCNFWFHKRSSSGDIIVTFSAVLYGRKKYNLLACDLRSIRFKGNDVITRQATGTNGRAKSRLRLGRLAARVQEPRNAQTEKEQWDRCQGGGFGGRKMGGNDIYQVFKLRIIPPRHPSIIIKQIWGTNSNGTEKTKDSEGCWK